MAQEKSVVYPYIPNSVPEIKKTMKEAVGIQDTEELYIDIPEALRYRKRLNVPEPFLSEYDLERHVTELLGKNKTCTEFLNFLGAGCYQHHVPAPCDSIPARDEFLTAYAGGPHEDLGKGQTIFEYQSLITQLVGMEVTGFPAYDSAQSGSTAVRIAARITGRSQVLIPASINPRQLGHMQNYCKDSEVQSIEKVHFGSDTGLMDLEDLKAKLSDETAAVYIENPSYLGVIESQAEEIGKLAHEKGALLVISVNAISLGVLKSPGDYGADIVCGNTQPLGVHMNAGGGATGFVAVNDNPDHYNELPGMIITLLDLAGDEAGFGFHHFGLPERLSYMAREHAKEYTGTNTALLAVSNTIYLSLMGPRGMAEIGETIVQKAHYAKQKLAGIPGVKMHLSAPHFNEFVVNFDDTGKSVADINKALLDHQIFGGKDLSGDFPELGQSALYCVTEIHRATDIQRLAAAIKEVIA
ncbi:MAG: aminomethyl-transferring glycine dehydrogenase subunit GcvPA [Deltaproteobacteria bacterium]|nr:aminomethyl-transferring glycine dehydrogenase subunit GcvPA [Deltaproteobacteria bacterium]